MLSCRDAEPWALVLSWFTCYSQVSDTGMGGAMLGLFRHKSLQVGMQVPLEELLALTAALESQSEHPLAGSVLDFAQSRLAPLADEADPEELQPAASDASSPVKETEMLLLSPSSPSRLHRKQPRRTDWLRSAKDVESRQGSILPCPRRKHNRKGAPALQISGCCFVQSFNLSWFAQGKAWSDGLAPPCQSSCQLRRVHRLPVSPQRTPSGRPWAWGR